MNGVPQQPDQAPAWAAELDGDVRAGEGLDVVVPAAITAEAPPVTLEGLELADFIIDADGIVELGELLETALPLADQLAGGEPANDAAGMAQLPVELSAPTFDILFDDGTGPVVSAPII
jgi:hypothetical protein